MYRSWSPCRHPAESSWTLSTSLVSSSTLSMLVYQGQKERKTYPFSKPAMKSRCGPSGVKLVTRNQLVFWLSRGPEFVATLYLRISDPVLVGTTSGESPSRPMRVIFANVDARLLVENARALAGRVRRRRKADILLGGRWWGGNCRR